MRDILDKVTTKTSDDKPCGSKRRERTTTPINTGERVAYSMDVEKLYLSITAKQAGETVKRAVDVTLANINLKMALRYITKCAKDDKEVRAWGLSKCCPVRTKTPGPRSGVTGAGIEDDKWTDGRVPPDVRTRRQIIWREDLPPNLWRPNQTGPESRGGIARNGIVRCGLHGEV